MDAQVGAYLLGRARLPFRLAEPLGDRALLIVETRPSYFLPHVVATAVQTHPGWRLYVVGTPAVHDLLERHCANYHLATRVDLAAAKLSISEYSRMMLTPEVWTIVQEEHVLVFQSDCVLVRQTPDEFLRFAYVGARCGVDVMNGGLSLRRRSAMLRACEVLGRPAAVEVPPEDVVLCRLMRQHPAEFELPTGEQCDRFAIESIGDPSRAIGLHGTDKYYAPPDLVAALLK